MSGHNGDVLIVLDQEEVSETKEKQVAQRPSITINERARKLYPLVRLLAHEAEQPVSFSRNESIPAGYTYLAQMMIHDLTQHGAPLNSTAGQKLERRDHRQNQLVLDSVYGGGPTISPNLFETAYEAGHEKQGRRPITRTKLRLGRIKSTGRKPQAEVMPALDLPRMGCPFASEAPAVSNSLSSLFHGGLSDAPLKGQPDALIADPRNDDNAVLSQLVVFFHIFHNWVIEKLEGKRQAGADESTGRYVRFLIARRLVAASFRSVIQFDLMERLLTPSIYKRYMSEDNPFGMDRVGGQVPVEFSHGVGRFAHSMIAEKYRFLGDDPFDTIAVLSQNSRRRPRDMPFSREWLAPWSKFFDGISEEEPSNLSRLIQPSYNRQLANLNMIEKDLLRAGVNSGGGLMMFDFLRSHRSNVMDVKSIRKTIGDEAFSKTSLYADPSGEIACREMGDWLRKTSERAPQELRLDDSTIDFIVEDPPLSFYTCLESLYEEKGMRLGVIGSIVFAESVFPALRAAEDSDLDISMAIFETKTLGALSEELVPEVAQKHMGTLIRHVANETRKDGLNTPILT